MNWKKAMGMAALVVFAVSTALLVRDCIRYAAGRTEYQQLLKTAGDVAGRNTRSEEVNYLEGENYLLAKNTDYIGWIQIDGTSLSYPLVREREDGYYLTHTFSGEENPCGTIFMDQNCVLLQGGNTILYGHNMKDGSMFGMLKKFKTPEYLKDHGLVRVFAGGEEHIFRIFACVLAEEGKTPAYTVTFGSMEERLAFIDQMKQESVVSTEYVPQPADIFLTLSTCTGPGGRDRLLILAAEPMKSV